MNVSIEEKNQILLASRKELAEIDIQYGHIYSLYRDVLDHIFSLAQQCQEFKLPDAIREIKKRPTELKDPVTTKEKILKRRAKG